MIDLTGGPRAFDRAGFRDEEGTNWERAELLVSAQLAGPRTTPYDLGPGSGVSSAAFDRAAIRVPTDREAFRAFTEGIEVTGDLGMPLVTMHTTGDGQVPINQPQALRRRVDGAGRGNLLVQRVIEDPGHCGFTTGEQEAAFQALVDWVEDGRVPDGTNLDVDDLTSLDRTFELAPRPDRAARGSSSDQHAVIRGRARLDGAPLDARWIGAVVLNDGLVTACNTTLPAVAGGDFEVSVYASAESDGCGQPGAEVLLWTYAGERKLYATTTVAWPDDGTARVEVDFSTRRPLGTAPTATELGGEVYDQDGQRVPPGSRVEAYVGETLCGVASVRWSDFYILTVAGPDSLPGCVAGGTITFRVKKYFRGWHEAQQRYGPMVEQAFAPIPIRQAPYFDREVVGLGILREMGKALYGETDPTAQYYHGRPYTVSRDDGQFVLSVELPFATKEEIALSRHADEILIDVGSWRRNLVLPRALIEAETLGAKFDDHVLKIRFAAPPRNSNGGGSRG